MGRVRNSMDKQRAKGIRLKAKLRWRYLRREVLGISQATTARLCGVSRGTVARWESPESRMMPDVGTILILCEIKRYDPKAMMGWIAGGAENVA